MARASYVDEIAAAREVCRALGFGDVSLSLLKAAHRTTMLIAPLGLIACVQSSEPEDAAWDGAMLEIEVARHLAEHGAPVIAPLDARLAGPHRYASIVITLWPHMPSERPADEADAPLAASTLASVHRALSTFPGALPPFTRTLDRCWAVLTGRQRLDRLAAEDRALLQFRYRELRDQIEAAPVRHVPLHGDAHLGNMVIGLSRPVWTDFEDTCIGPREIDIACLPPDVWPHFEDADPTLLAQCAALKSVCVAVWCWADPWRSPAMREAADYHLDQVRRSIL